MPHPAGSTGISTWFTKPRVVTAHCVLVSLLLAWRALGAVPALAPERGSDFFSSRPMELAAVISILAAVAAAAVVAIGTLRARRDWKLLLLLALFAGSMWRRVEPLDAFDFAYIAAVLVTGARGLTHGRDRPAGASR